MTDKKISELDPAAALSGSEEVPVVQTAATVRTTAQDIANLATGGKITISGNINFYVATTGSNSNNGLTALTPWQTIQYAADFVAKNYRNPTNYFVTINVAAGTYNEAPIKLPFNECGTGGILILGNTVAAFRDPAVPIIPSVAGSFLIISEGNWSVDGFVLGEAAPVNVPSYICYAANPGSILSTYSVSFGKCSTACLGAEFGGIVYGDYNEIFGTCGSYLYARSGGVAEHTHDPIVLSVDPGASAGFLHASRYGVIHFNPDNGGVSGTSTGSKYYTDEFGRIYTSVVVPGTSTGSIAQSTIVSSLDVITAPSFVGDGGAGGQIGYVPAPATGDATKFLRGDATWVAISGGTPGGSSTQIQYNNSSAFGGFGYFDGTNHNLAVGTGSGNFGTISGTNDVIVGDGSGNAITSGASNTILGQGSGTGITTGGGNTIVGSATGTGVTTGSYNTIIGKATGLSSSFANNVIVADGQGNMGLTYISSLGNLFAGGGGNLTASGIYNFGLGYLALGSVTSGTRNLCIGNACGQSLTTATDIVLIGTSAGGAATNPTGLVGIGTNVFASATSCSASVCIGTSSLAGAGSQPGAGITTGTRIICIGDSAGCGGNCSNSVIIGVQAGQNTSGAKNTLIGDTAGYGVTSGIGNVIIGYSLDTAASYSQVTTGSHNVSIGYNVAVPTATVDNQLCISNYIYGTGMDGTGTTISAGKVGLGIKAPNFNLDVAGSLGSSEAAFILHTSTTITGGSTANAPTLTTGPVNGDPTKWLPYDDNGTTRYIPAW